MTKSPSIKSEEKTAMSAATRTQSRYVVTTLDVTVCTFPYAVFDRRHGCELVTSYRTAEVAQEACDDMNAEHLADLQFHGGGDTYGGESYS